MDKNNQLNNNNLLKREYDENIYIYGEGVREVSRAQSKLTSIELKVLSDMPCVQFYTANELRETKGKQEYNRNNGFCVETQFNPQDVIKGKVYLEKNKTFKTSTFFIFNILNK